MFYIIVLLILVFICSFRGCPNLNVLWYSFSIASTRKHYIFNSEQNLDVPTLHYNDVSVNILNTTAKENF